MLLSGANMEGIEHTDWKGCFDAGDSVLLQRGIYTVYRSPHCIRSKTRLEECSTRQVISKRGNSGVEVKGLLRINVQ